MWKFQDSSTQLLLNGGEKNLWQIVSENSWMLFIKLNVAFTFDVTYNRTKRAFNFVNPTGCFITFFAKCT